MSSQVNAGPPGGIGWSSNYVCIGEITRTLAAGATFVTTTKGPLLTNGFPRLSYYILVTADPAAAQLQVLAEFSFDNANAGGRTYLPVALGFAAVLNVPLINGFNAFGQPIYLPCQAARMTIVAGAGGPVTFAWYIGAGP